MSPFADLWLSYSFSLAPALWGGSGARTPSLSLLSGVSFQPQSSLGGLICISFTADAPSCLVVSSAAVEETSVQIFPPGFITGLIVLFAVESSEFFISGI